MSKTANPPANRNPHPTTRPPREIKIPNVYHVIIKCRSEAEQRKLYDQLTTTGHTCKVLTLVNA